jgi:hypothetical protein
MVRYKPTITGHFMILKNWMYAVGMKKAGLWGTFRPRTAQQMLFNNTPYDTPELQVGSAKKYRRINPHRKHKSQEQA